MVERKSKAPRTKKLGSTHKGVTARRARFIEAYLSNNQNGKQAAITAGFSAKGAEAEASRLLTNINVSEEIDRRLAELRVAAEARTGVTVEGVLCELRDLLHSDLRRAFDENGAMLPPHMWPDDLARAVCSIKVVERDDGTPKHVPMYVKEIKFWDKGGSIERAMKHLGMFKEDNKQRGDAAIRALMEAVSECDDGFKVRP